MRLSARASLLVILGLVVPTHETQACSGGGLEPVIIEYPLNPGYATRTFTTIRDGALAAARETSLGNDWIIQLDALTGRFHAAYGGGEALPVDVSDRQSLARSAMDFLARHSELTGVVSENCELRNIRTGGEKIAVHFRQLVNDIPVYGATAFVLLDDRGSVLAFGSDFVQVDMSKVQSNLVLPNEAMRLARNSIGASLRVDRPHFTELWYATGEAAAPMTLYPVYRVVFISDSPLGRWEIFVDARSGKILGRQNLYDLAIISGNIQGLVQDPSWCDGSSSAPLSHLEVSVAGGNSDNTDGNGDFEISESGGGQVTVQAELKGEFVDVNLSPLIGADARISTVAGPGEPVDIVFDESNSRQDERDGFLHANRAHDFVKGLDPSLTGLDYAMPVMVGRCDGFCPGNAWWDGVGINFCDEDSAGVFANTAEISSVVYHEYGHEVTEQIYERNVAPIPPSDLREGNSDVMAFFLNRNSVFAEGLMKANCLVGPRDADNDLVWPDDLQGDGHLDGQILAGFYWDAWQSLLSARPQSGADATIYSLWHLARDMGTPQNQPDQVLWTFLMDDDDGSMSNGTPNYEHLCAAAMNHGFECPEIQPPVAVRDLPGPGSLVVHLGQNVPNPFSGATTFRYSIQREAFVELAVFDVSGRRVNTLVRSRQGGGEHEIRWETGGLSSGVYFYRLKVNEEMQIKKLLVIE